MPSAIRQIIRIQLSGWILLIFLSTGCQERGNGEQQNLPDSMGTSAGFITKNGSVVFAAKVPLVFSFAPEVPADMIEACGRAAKTLNSADGKTLFQFASPAQKVGGPTPTFLIRWGTSQSSEPDHQASTDLTIEGSTIVGAEINFDTGHFVYSDTPDDSKIDNESVCLHELGHALGLAHSPSAQSFMYAFLRGGQVRRELSEEDRKNLLQVY